MKYFIFKLFSLFFVLSLVEVSFASTDATCLVYQPIDMRSESTVIKLPASGFMIIAVPYTSGFSLVENPYHAITLPFSMLSTPKQKDSWDSNLASRAGIQIKSQCIFEGEGKESKLKNEVVTVNISKCVIKDKDYGPSLETVLEATLECIRRTATDKHQQWIRPEIKILGKPSDKDKWSLWEDKFNKQDFSKPFTRPDLGKK